MKSKAEPDEKWIKAAIIGATWAASEIVLGSFLHNLKIPFSGNILTAIGTIILISVSYIWKEKGLFWRAGLICAIMKTMSPSAVIFGPMIAIFSEALLLEISVRMLGRTIPGYILGSILAMSWNLFQKLVNLVIFYGFNIIELYRNLVKYAEKQLDIHTDLFWAPLLLLLVVYSLMGVVTAILGIRVGRQIQNHPMEVNSISHPDTYSPDRKGKQDFNYSLPWLFADILLMISALAVLNFVPVLYGGAWVAMIVTLWVFRYKRAMRQLSKPKFWVYFVVVTMLSAFVFSKIQSGSIENGLLTGLQMNFRAVIIITGFSVLGTELYNPLIRDFFLRTSFKQLPLALELSFASLPSMISNIPDFKTLVKNPVSVISRLLSQVDSRLAGLKARLHFHPEIFIITGSVGQGKTTFLQKVLEELHRDHIHTRGFYCPKVSDKEGVVGYDLVDISTGQRKVFLRATYEENLRTIGRYRLYPAGLSQGINALKVSHESQHVLLVIDEVGRLELNGLGWAPAIDEMVKTKAHPVLMVVRNSLVGQVMEKWQFARPFVFSIADSDPPEVCRLIIEKISWEF